MGKFNPAFQLNSEGQYQGQNWRDTAQHFQFHRGDTLIDEYV
jgi:hypothetical protein